VGVRADIEGGLRGAALVQTRDHLMNHIGACEKRLAQCHKQSKRLVAWNTHVVSKR
jgi:hypothetical protein